jgi:hypothetical protein
MIALGEVIIHGEAELAIQRANQTVQEFLDRFRAGDFGDIDAETRQFNEAALRDGDDMLGIYELCSGLPLWIIGDGKQTDVVLP